MALDKLNNILSGKVKELAAKQSLKSREHVITGIKKSDNGFGPRYYLSNQQQTEYLRFNSNSYLGLNLDSRVIKAEEEAATKFGTGPGAVRFISGTFASHRALEKQLAKFHDREDAILFSAAYGAVIGVLHSLITKETIVISDALNHNSIINGIRISRPVDKLIYPHLDIMELDNLFRTIVGKASRVIVVTDGIFSMRGDHAPLAEINQVCRKYEHEFQEGVITIMDDSHGVGSFGATGRGVEEYEQASADILIGTLGKAFGVNGGYAVTSNEVIKFLRETAPLYIYTNPITPSEASAASRSIEILDSQEGISLLNTIARLTSKFENGLQNLGLEILTSKHPIVPLMTRDTKKNTAMIDHLFDNQILATGLNFPVVPKGDQSIRFQINGCHTTKDVEYVLNVLAGFN